VNKTVAVRGKYFPDGFYTMHSDNQLQDIAESTTLPTAMRLYFLAAARSNMWGHAPFGRKEICDILGISEPTRRKAIDSLRLGKVIAPESTHLCVALSAAVIRRGDRAYRTCIEPSHFDCQRLMWAAGFGWETSEGQWQANVNDGQASAVIARRTTRKRRIVEEVETTEEVASLANLPWPAPVAGATDTTQWFAA
jgi:hypothetical protein